MNNEQLLNEIREANLSYMVLVQNLVRQDPAEAMVRIGLSEDVAEMIAGLTIAQMLRIAARNVLICRFRFDDEIVWNLLTDHGVQSATKSVHASILMASLPAEGIA
ncbi:MAG: flagellar transcriptional regulator FlhD [Burkholderiales bacterium]